MKQKLIKLKGEIDKLPTVSPLYPQVPYSWIQPTMDGKYLEKKFQKAPKSKT